MKRFRISRQWALFLLLLMFWISLGARIVHGQAATPHSTTLYWNWATTPTNTDQATNFAVFRATAATGPFTQIGTITPAAAALSTGCVAGSAGVTSPCFTYVDLTIVPGTQYWYEIDAVDANGDLSGPDTAGAVTGGTTPGNPPPATAAAAVTK